MHESSFWYRVYNSEYASISVVEIDATLQIVRSVPKNRGARKLCFLLELWVLEISDNPGVRSVLSFVLLLLNLQ